MGEFWENLIARMAPPGWIVDWGAVATLGAVIVALSFSVRELCVHRRSEASACLRIAAKLKASITLLEQRRQPNGALIIQSGAVRALIEDMRGLRDRWELISDDETWVRVHANIVGWCRVMETHLVSADLKIRVTAEIADQMIEPLREAADFAARWAKVRLSWMPRVLARKNSTH